MMLLLKEKGELLIAQIAPERFTYYKGASEILHELYNEFEKRFHANL